MERNFIRLTINGQTQDVSGAEAFLPLAQYLRYQKQLVGTKIVCSEGDCGACTVLVAHYREGQWSPFKTINSCIAPLYLQDLSCVVTVEGLQDQERLSTVQEKMIQHHGGQCGYCTPGMVCSIAGLAEDCKNDNTPITEKKARNYLTGNLCRCTGYEPILTAAQDLDLSQWTTLAKKYLTNEVTENFGKLSSKNVHIKHDNKVVTMPVDLKTALEAKNHNPQVRLVSGATDLGVVANKGKLFLDQVLSLSHVSSLHKISDVDGGVGIGPLVTLTEVQLFLKNKHPELSRLLNIFASPQIKNQGTLVGNIINGSPIGDMIPPLLTLEAELKLSSTKGTRRVPLTQFYKAYKVMDLQADEICTGIFIPTLKGTWLSRFYKISMRKDLDISAVTFAAIVQVQGQKISAVRIAMGGVGPTVKRITPLEQKLLGQDFSEAVFTNAGQEVSQWITPISDLRASADYRKLVAQNFIRKFYLETQGEALP